MTILDGLKPHPFFFQEMSYMYLAEVIDVHKAKRIGSVVFENITPIIDGVYMVIAWNKYGTVNMSHEVALMTSGKLPSSHHKAYQKVLKFSTSNTLWNKCMLNFG